jgi:hypothetical protein
MESRKTEVFTKLPIQNHNEREQNRAGGDDHPADDAMGDEKST